MKKKLQLFIWGANILLVGITLISYFSPHISPDSFAFVSIIGLGYPALLFCNLLVIIYWFVFGSKRWLLSFVILLFGYSSCNRLLTFSVADKPTAGKKEINVGSYNINFSKPIALAPKDEQEELEAGFNNYLKANRNMDVLAVQEHGWRSKEYLRSALDLPYVYEEENMTVAIYSKFPFVDKGKVDFESNIANTCLWADIDFGSDTVRVYTAHLESNRHDGHVPKVIDQEAPEAMSNSALFGLVLHYKKFAIERAKQARLIQQHRFSSPHPSIICSDINDTPQTYVYNIIRNDMKDSFEDEGNGLGTTFGEKIPALRIDHILVDKSIKVLDHTIKRSDYSDHYLQIAKIEI